jgi:LPS sulfotransferase NodH
MHTNHHGTSARFLFILSTERSGSTLLSVLLGAHHNVIAPPELHLQAYSTFDEWRQQYPSAMKSLCFLLLRVA